MGTHTVHTSEFIQRLRLLDRATRDAQIESINKLARHGFYRFGVTTNSTIEFPSKSTATLLCQAEQETSREESLRYKILHLLRLSLKTPNGRIDSWSGTLFWITSECMTSLGAKYLWMGTSAESN